MSPSDPILVLHLSDLHFGPNSRFAGVDPNEIAKRFVGAANRARERLGLSTPVSLAVVTGDVAEAARPKEYEAAQSFFINLAASLGLDHQRFVFVPGNHDVSWPACKRAEADQEEFDFGDDELRRRFNRDKFANFESFLSEFYGAPFESVGVRLPASARVYDFPDLEITVAGLNSCEVESHRLEDHRGFLGRKQAQGIMDHWGTSEVGYWLKLVAVHHNPVVTVLENIREAIDAVSEESTLDARLFERYVSDLVGFEGKEYLRRISENCEVQLILHGHHHATDQHLWPWPPGRQGDTHILSAGSGALVTDKLPRDHSNSIGLILLDPAREKIRSWVLEYAPRRPSKDLVVPGDFVPEEFEPYERSLALPSNYPRSKLLVEHAKACLRQALENIRLGQLAEARETLQDLENIGEDLPAGLLAQILYDRACLESIAAESLSPRTKKYRSTMDNCLLYLEKWLRLGQARAWAEEAKTERNEIFRMGCDVDLRHILIKRRNQILSIIPDNLHSALPKELPQKRATGGGGGGCVPAHTLIQTPTGYVPVEQLRKGDWIVSFEFGSQHSLITTRIVHMYTSRAYEGILLNGRSVFTPSHIIYNENKAPIRVDQAEPGTMIFNTQSGSELVVTNEIVEDYLEIYNLKTNHCSHNYITGDGILSHNKKIIWL